MSVGVLPECYCCIGKTKPRLNRSQIDRAFQADGERGVRPRILCNIGDRIAATNFCFQNYFQWCAQHLNSQNLFMIQEIYRRYRRCGRSILAGENIFCSLNLPFQRGFIRRKQLVVHFVVSNSVVLQSGMNGIPGGLRGIFRREWAGFRSCGISRIPIKIRIIEIAHAAVDCVHSRANRAIVPIFVGRIGEPALRAFNAACATTVITGLDQRLNEGDGLQNCRALECHVLCGIHSFEQHVQFSALNIISGL